MLNEFCFRSAANPGLGFRPPGPRSRGGASRSCRALGAGRGRSLPPAGRGRGSAGTSPGPSCAAGAEGGRPLGWGAAGGLWWPRSGGVRARGPSRARGVGVVGGGGRPGRECGGDRDHVRARVSPRGPRGRGPSPLLPGSQVGGRRPTVGTRPAGGAGGSASG